jgi:hypothetical protein
MCLQRCLSPGACEHASSGFLHVSKFSSGVGASGDYELRFRDGTSRMGVSEQCGIGTTFSAADFFRVRSG